MRICVSVRANLSHAGTSCAGQNVDNSTRHSSHRSSGTIAAQPSDSVVECVGGLRGGQGSLDLAEAARAPTAKGFVCYALRGDGG